MWKRSTGLTICLLGIACSGDSRVPTAPVAVPPPAVPVMGPTTRTIHGVITDGNFVIANATVAIVAGLGVGTVRTSGPDGRFTLPAVPHDAGEIRILATREGFKPREHTLVITPESPPVSLHVVLEPVSFGNVSGAWRLTVEAAAACGTLPHEARTRQYDAVIDQSGALATLRLLSSDFLRAPELDGTVYATTARIGASCWWDEPCIIERLASGDVVSISGVVEVSLEPNRLSGALEGTFGVFPNGNLATASASCASREHRFILER